MKRNHFKFRESRDKLYMQTYLDRATISPKVYKYCLRVLKREEVKVALGLHRISIIRIVMLKANVCS